VFLVFGRLAALPDRSGNAPLNRNGSSKQLNLEVTLMIERSWRIEDEQTIICGSWSDVELWQLSFTRLLGRSVIDLRTFGRQREISVALSGGFYFASLMTSEGDSQWAIIDRGGQSPAVVNCKLGAIQLALMSPTRESKPLPPSMQNSAPPATLCVAYQTIRA
jgi:hypothetical protein